MTYIGIGQNYLKNIDISDIGKNPIYCIPIKNMNTNYTSISFILK